MIETEMTQTFFYYRRQCLGSEPKLFHNNVYSASKIDYYIFEC